MTPKLQASIFRFRTFPQPSPNPSNLLLRGERAKSASGGFDKSLVVDHDSFIALSENLHFLCLAQEEKVALGNLSWLLFRFPSTLLLLAIVSVSWQVSCKTCFDKGVYLGFAFTVGEACEACWKATGQESFTEEVQKSRRNFKQQMIDAPDQVAFLTHTAKLRLQVFQRQ